MCSWQMLHNNDAAKQNIVDQSTSGVNLFSGIQTETFHFVLMTSWMWRPERKQFFFLANPFLGKALAAAAALVWDFALCQVHSNVSLY